MPFYRELYNMPSAKTIVLSHEEISGAGIIVPDMLAKFVVLASTGEKPIEEGLRNSGLVVVVDRFSSDATQEETIATHPYALAHDEQDMIAPEVEEFHSAQDLVFNSVKIAKNMLVNSESTLLAFVASGDNLPADTRRALAKIPSMVQGASVTDDVDLPNDRHGIHTGMYL